MIYHITDRAAWAEARERGQYSAPSLENEGFIHCSKREQVLDVANDFYREQADLVLLCIDKIELRAELRWEGPAHPKPHDGAGTRDDSLFPHLYGVLNLDAVVAVFDFNQSESGFTLPPNLP